MTGLFATVIIASSRRPDLALWREASPLEGEFRHEYWLQLVIQLRCSLVTRSCNTCTIHAVQDATRSNFAFKEKKTTHTVVLSRSMILVALGERAGWGQRGGGTRGGCRTAEQISSLFVLPNSPGGLGAVDTRYWQILTDAASQVAGAVAFCWDTWLRSNVREDSLMVFVYWWGCGVFECQSLSLGKGAFGSVRP